MSWILRLFLLCGLSWVLLEVPLSLWVYWQIGAWLWLWFAISGLAGWMLLWICGGSIGRMLFTSLRSMPQHMLAHRELPFGRMFWWGRAWGAAWLLILPGVLSDVYALILLLPWPIDRWAVPLRRSRHPGPASAPEHVEVHQTGHDAEILEGEWHEVKPPRTSTAPLPRSTREGGKRSKG